MYKHFLRSLLSQQSICSTNDCFSPLQSELSDTKENVGFISPVKFGKDDRLHLLSVQ